MTEDNISSVIEILKQQLEQQNRQIEQQNKLIESLQKQIVNGNNGPHAAPTMGFEEARDLYLKERHSYITKHSMAEKKRA